ADYGSVQIMQSLFRSNATAVQPRCNWVFRGNAIRCADRCVFAAIERQRIEAFFRVYKQLPEGRKKVELNGFGNAEEARKMIQQAMDNYKK
ncbi:inorganic diphosphatase, partial [Pseudomonas sp.]|uniref:inorganic diphosphatase n=1 Tax=Pseudomonas sp. TaxID=306 RepID=UPI0037CBE9E1